MLSRGQCSTRKQESNRLAAAFAFDSHCVSAGIEQVV